MARQLESISKVDSLKNKIPSSKDIAEYLLTTEDSTLTLDALSIFRDRDTYDFIRIIGDDFFRDLFSKLLNSWRLKTLDADENVATSAV